MLDRICTGEASGIFAWHPDRLARNSIDGGKIIYLLDTEKTKDLKFPTFWFENMLQGKFMLSIVFVQSKYYVDNLSENIKRETIAKNCGKEFGQTLCPALGYLNNHRTKEIDLNKEKGPCIRKAFELYATGDYPLKAIRQFLTDSGIESYRNKPFSVFCCSANAQKSFLLRGV